MITFSQQHDAEGFILYLQYKFCEILNQGGKVGLLENHSFVQKWYIFTVG